MTLKVKCISALLLSALFALKAQNSANQPSAKDDAAAQAAKDQLTNAATAGTPLPASTNVADNVNIEAVMLPADVARRLFGREVSDNYAVIEVNLSNRSNQAGLIVQSLFIDLSQWGLAGPMGSGLTAAGVTRSRSKPYQARSSPLEVSSVEYRIVRGELLDWQPWTKRNIAYRTIEVLGSIGTAFVFPFSTNIVKGVAGWNGAVVPGFATLFPDGTQAQLDRISDYGFRNNKVIPQQAADILVAFFPICRFLTPTLQKVFLKTPSLFFNPVLMVVDPATRKLLDPILNNVLGSKAAVDQQYRNLLDEYAKLDQGTLANDIDRWQQDLDEVAKANAAVVQDGIVVNQDQTNPKMDPAVAAKHAQTQSDDQAKLDKAQKQRDTDKAAVDTLMKPLTDIHLYNLLSNLSLNNVHVVVSGVMTVDVDNVPAVITSITCTDEPAKLWPVKGDHDCAIHGSFLTNGQVAIAEDTKLGLKVTTVATGSTDAVLNFKLTISDPIAPKTVLTFQVTKKNKQGSTVESMKFPYAVPDYTAPAPSITSVTVKDTTVTVAGSNFSDTTASPLAVTAHPFTPSGLSDQKIEKPTSTDKQIQFDDKGFAPACWQVQVKVGSVQAPASTDKPPKDQFALAPTPKITAATLSGTTLTVTGEQLIDLDECGAAMTFQVLSDATGAKPEAVTKTDISSDGKQATMQMPTLAAGAKWKEVDVLISAKEVTSAAIASQPAASKPKKAPAKAPAKPAPAK